MTTSLVTASRMTASLAVTAARQVLAPYPAQPAIHRQWTKKLLANGPVMAGIRSPGRSFGVRVHNGTRVLPILSTHLSTGLLEHGSAAAGAVILSVLAGILTA